MGVGEVDKREGSEKEKKSKEEYKCKSHGIIEVRMFGVVVGVFLVVSVLAVIVAVAVVGAVGGVVGAVAVVVVVAAVVVVVIVICEH